MCDMSLLNYSVFKESEGNQDIQTKNGYKKILELLIGDKKDSFYHRLRFECSLEKILLCTKNLDKNCEHCLFSQNQNDVILMINGPGNKEIIVACENVLCTMSLGCLKKNLTNLIQPNHLIAEAKLSAVRRLGYGTVNKVQQLKHSNK